DRPDRPHRPGDRCLPGHRARDRRRPGPRRRRRRAVGPRRGAAGRGAHRGRGAGPAGAGPAGRRHRRRAVRPPGRPGGRGARAARRAGQQRGRLVVPGPVHRAALPRLGEGDAPQRRLRRPPQPGRRPPHARAPHRVGDQRRVRRRAQGHPCARALRRVQGGGDQPHPLAGARVGDVGSAGQRAVPGLDADRPQRRPVARRGAGRLAGRHDGDEALGVAGGDGRAHGVPGQRRQQLRHRAGARRRRWRAGL
ncbi:MAG: 3-oxoacyl-[acyl-carrier protein] reductase, partial [uncultured Frankineae bacterium]